MAVDLRMTLECASSVVAGLVGGGAAARPWLVELLVLTWDQTTRMEEGCLRSLEAFERLKCWVTRDCCEQRCSRVSKGHDADVQSSADSRRVGRRMGEGLG